MGEHNASELVIAKLAQGSLPNSTKIPVLQPSQQVWSFGTVLHVMPVIAICIGVLLSIVICREALLFFNVFGEQQPIQHKHRTWMISLEMFRMLVCSADNSFLLPGALNLSRAMGCNATMSGILDQ